MINAEAASQRINWTWTNRLNGRCFCVLLIESGSPASRANSRLVPSDWQPLNC